MFEGICLADSEPIRRARRSRTLLTTTPRQCFDQPSSRRQPSTIGRYATSSSKRSRSSATRSSLATRGTRLPALSRSSAAFPLDSTLGRSVQHTRQDGLRARAVFSVRMGNSPVDPRTSVRMRSVRQRDTGAELSLRSQLHRLGLRYRVDRRPLATVSRRADVVFRRARVAVFVDGCFWHGCASDQEPPRTNTRWWIAKIARNRARDRDTDVMLRHAGWKVIRVWEHEHAATAPARNAAGRAV